jgi:hypothetical protein
MSNCNENVIDKPPIAVEEEDKSQYNKNKY